MVGARDWLLMFIAADAARAVDPVRLQKGLFLLAMRGVAEAGEAYVFEPYAYGPMSRAVYRDTRALRDAGLVVELAVDGQAWRRLRATERGCAAAQSLRATVPAERAAAVDAIRSEVDALSFGALLERVYDAYPAYATRSAFRRRSS